MAIHIYTKKPKALLNALKSQIAEGSVETWSVDGEGDFTHTSSQWNEKAWFRPYSEKGMLAFGLVGKEGRPMNKAIYAQYHGKFISMLLSHFDTDFDSVVATAIGDEMRDTF